MVLQLHLGGKDFHLRLDITDELAALGQDSEELKALLNSAIKFIEFWDRERPLLIHCFAGVNRSAAILYMALCIINPLLAELTIARLINPSSV